MFGSAGMLPASRRVGKSSLLNRMHGDCESKGVQAVYRSVPDAEDELDELSEEDVN